MGLGELGKYGKYEDIGAGLYTATLFGASMGAIFGYWMFGAWWGPFAGFFVGALVGVVSMVGGILIVGAGLCVLLLLLFVAQKCFFFWLK